MKHLFITCMMKINYLSSMSPELDRMVYFHYPTGLLYKKWYNLFDVYANHG
ncbi:hypothetical protein SD77_1656 [Bacillus badius]|uniref:Uncharacterized protein n=1 Tax=Bacillus badius TaxID=1455 RepID=A0ABR5AR20_BACBA|nr:hypothetical protein SD77_1656 [Bacillus badius]